MKVFLAFFLLLYCFNVNSQSSARDSANAANDTLDAMILRTIESFDEFNYDYLILREYDSAAPMIGEYHILKEQDSCSSMFGWNIESDFSIGHFSVGKIQSRKSIGGCSQYADFDKIKLDLTRSVNYFDSTNVDSLNFRTARYTLYGKIDGEYLFQTFELEFVTSFHSGMLHDVICREFGLRRY